MIVRAMFMTTRFMFAMLVTVVIVPIMLVSIVPMAFVRPRCGQEVRQDQLHPALRTRCWL